MVENSIDSLDYSQMMVTHRNDPSNFGDRVRGKTTNPFKQYHQIYDCIMISGGKNIAQKNSLGWDSQKLSKTGYHNTGIFASTPIRLLVESQTTSLKIC